MLQDGDRQERARLARERAAAASAAARLAAEAAAAAEAEARLAEADVQGGQLAEGVAGGPTESGRILVHPDEADSLRTTEQSKRTPKSNDSNLALQQDWLEKTSAAADEEDYLNLEWRTVSGEPPPPPPRKPKHVKKQVSFERRIARPLAEDTSTAFGSAQQLKRAHSLPRSLARSEFRSHTQSSTVASVANPASASHRQLDTRALGSLRRSLSLDRRSKRVSTHRLAIDGVHHDSTDGTSIEDSMEAPIRDDHRASLRRTLSLPRRLLGNKSFSPKQAVPHETAGLERSDQQPCSERGSPPSTSIHIQSRALPSSRSTTAETESPSSSHSSPDQHAHRVRRTNSSESMSRRLFSAALSLGPSLSRAISWRKTRPDPVVQLSDVGLLPSESRQEAQHRARSLDVGDESEPSDDEHGRYAESFISTSSYPAPTADNPHRRVRRRRRSSANRSEEYRRAQTRDEEAGKAGMENPTTRRDSSHSPDPLAAHLKEIELQREVMMREAISRESRKAHADTQRGQLYRLDPLVDGRARDELDFSTERPWAASLSYVSAPSQTRMPEEVPWHHRLSPWSWLGFNDTADTGLHVACVGREPREDEEGSRPPKERVNGIRAQPAFFGA